MPTPQQARSHFASFQQELRRPATAHDPHFLGLLRAFGADLEAVEALAQHSADIEDWVATQHLPGNQPRWTGWDGLGRHTAEITFHPAHREAGRTLWGSGLFARYEAPGNELTSLALDYIYSQSGEGGHACPTACTAGLIKVLRDHAESDAVDPEWLPGLLETNFDQALVAAQFLTEVQGGSDVGANVVKATPQSDGTARITGEKWFCSVANADLFLMTARPDGAPDGTRGLQAYVVPRVHDGAINNFRIRRLKNKLGTRAMASGEIDFEGAWAVPVADFATTVGTVLTTSRLHNSVVSAAFLQRAWREAWLFASQRRAFGQALSEAPLIQHTLARLWLRAHQARGLSFLLAHWSDQLETGQADAETEARFRFLVMLNKLWTSHDATTGLREAIEVLGGNGAIEDFSGLPRLLRDSIVMEAWEGGHNILSLQAVRTARKAGWHVPAFGWMEEVLGPDDPGLARARRMWELALAAPPNEAEAQARLLAQVMQGPAQRAALVQTGAPADVVASLETWERRGDEVVLDAGWAAGCMRSSSWPTAV